MYRVLLADDEPWILEGLKASIDWQAEGFCIESTADNGIKADQLLKQNPPDLALIDIRMPGMNGLEVIRRNREQCPDTHFVIISVYSEFEYARAGIDMSVSGYLLKPLEEHQLLALVRRVKSQLDEVSAVKESDLIFQDLETGTGYLLRRYPQGCHICLQASGNIDDIPGADMRVCIRPGHYLLISESPFALDEAALPPGILGVGCMQYGSGQLYDCLVQAECLAYSYFLCPHRRVFTLADAPGSTVETGALQKAITFGDPKQISTALKNIRASIANIKVSAIFQIYSGFSDVSAHGGLENMVRRYSTVDQLLDELEFTLAQTPSPQQSDSLPCAPADYIQEHCCENLSFIDLCKLFCMSASAMRTYLYRETGTTFSKYLNQMRMHQAADMLIHSTQSINEIAGACGFSDPLYFRKVFKRYYDKTPTEYRTDHQQADV